LNRDFLGTGMPMPVYVVLVVGALGWSAVSLKKTHDVSVPLEQRVGDVSLQMPGIIPVAYADQGPKYDVVASSYQGQ
jgi:hypothetical protein